MATIDLLLRRRIAMEDNPYIGIQWRKAWNGSNNMLQPVDNELLCITPFYRINEDGISHRYEIYFGFIRGEDGIGDTGAPVWIELGTKSYINYYAYSNPRLVSPPASCRYIASSLEK